MEIKSHVSKYYDAQAEREWARMERHRTEFAITQRLLAEYLPPPPAKILDCGGGPGRYAITLAQQGYAVTLFDLSPGSLELARSKAAEAGVRLEGLEQGSALDLGRFSAGCFDAVLLMGPLYHLLELEERLQALTETWRVLRDGGILFAAFLSRYAGHRDAANKATGWILDEPEASRLLWETGRLFPAHPERLGFSAYFAHPDEIPPLIWDAGFEALQTLGVEGLASHNEEVLNTLQGEIWERWVELNYLAAHDPSLFGGVEHLLAAACKPMWRSVLRQIARTLNGAGVGYTIAGGASIKLQGARILSKDIDIETDAEGAYRFQELFARHVREPVRLCESSDGQYRSHFGRFDFDGVLVEVIGEGHRREGQKYVPTWTCTRKEIDLDGVPVPVSWIEEELLAYIRRGRLDRVALCLSLCDRDKLLRLLHREEPVQVI